MEIQIFAGFGETLVEVFLALIPLLLFFLFFQFFLLKLSGRKLLTIFKGIVLAFFGLALFLQGVYVGFLPAGEFMGEAMGSLPYNWILVPIGFILGLAATFAEPAVRVMGHEVERASAGYIPAQIILYTMSLGVAISIALSMWRILAGFPLWYFIIPGYGLVLILMFISDRTFVGIAFDSGGVATGPMTVTFILTMALGVAASVEGRDPLLDGFGMIALVALSPILTVLILGLLYGRKGREHGE